MAVFYFSVFSFYLRKIGVFFLIFDLEKRSGENVRMMAAIFTLTNAGNSKLEKKIDLLPHLQSSAKQLLDFWNDFT